MQDISIDSKSREQRIRLTYFTTALMNWIVGGIAMADMLAVVTWVRQITID